MHTTAAPSEGTGTGTGTGPARRRVVVGSAFVPLKQFQSSFVVKLDVYAPLALTLNQHAPSSTSQLCNLKVMVGGGDVGWADEVGDGFWHGV